MRMAGDELMADWYRPGLQPIFAQPQQQPSADQMAQLAQTQLASQPQRFPTSYNTPQADAAAMSPETWENPIAHNLVHSVINGLMAPGRALASTEPMTSDQMIAPAMDMAGLATGGAGVVPAEANSLRMGIKAYHGSPHDFDRFSLDKIGTGEGAQAYGHGLYFAEREGVARSYRDALQSYTIDNKPVGQFLAETPKVDSVYDAIRHLKESGASPTIEDAAKFLDTSPIPSERAVADAVSTYDNIDTARSMLDKRHLPTFDKMVAEGRLTQNPGHMYEVNINADPEHFLDWDKPLAEQHPQTQDAVKQVMGPNWDQFRSATAGDAVKRGFIAPGEEGTAGALRDAGIPGIKYLDQGSRAAGDGSRNYVVFNDQLIDIARKYGLAGMTGAGAGLAAPIFAKSGEQKS
jgi:hypothetical protein